MTSQASSLLQATIEELRRHAPFDRMQAEDVQWLAARLQLGYYASGDIVLSPERGEATRFFIIKQGVVQGEQGLAAAQDDTAWLELHEGECFPLGALLARRSVTSTYRARDDVFCYELAAADFRALTHQSEAFHDFCTRRIANLLEQSKQIMQAQYSQSSSDQQSMSSTLAEIARRPPVTCAPDTPIREVLQTMQEQGIGAMIAVQDGKSVGIFTLHDVLGRVALPQFDVAQPVIKVMSRELFALPGHALAYEAALAMARHGIRHVLVTDNERLVGVVSEKDLFTLQRVGLREVGAAIRRAASPEQLRQAAQDIRQLGRNMLAQGVGAEQLTQIISTFNDLLTARTIELELDRARTASRQPFPEFCWLALGSEGRFEQTLTTDQDNGIIFAVPPGASADALRAVLLPVAQRINQTLAECGFPLCKGNVMASNPQWCLSLEEWRDTFGGWIQRGDPQVLLNATIFFDFRPLYGASELAHELRHWLNERIRGQRLFLRQMVENALNNRPPLGLLRDFVVDEGTLDLKVNGLAPFADAARIFALAAGSTETSTVRRLRAASATWRLERAEVEAWIEAFLFLQLLRLRLQHEQHRAGEAPSNRVNPDRLNHLDRRILKETFRQARKLQALLEHYFMF